MSVRKRHKRESVEARLGAVEWLRSAPRPFWLEPLASLEWLSLRTSSIYRAEDAPQGDGSAVITIPGFLGHDDALTEMRRWLDRLGYHAIASGVGRNMACPELSVRRLLHTIDDAYAATGRSVHLVGHSLGGVIARVSASMAPGMVASVTTLAAPIQGPRVHPLLLRVASYVLPACVRGMCSCIELLGEVTRPLPSSVRSLSFHTKTDGILDWRCCINRDQASHNYEVRGTHLGLPFNTAVYESMASFLADVRRIRLVGSERAPGWLAA
jgi:pimeloyl-ACP methyl ester carboxylesterase